MLALSHIWNFPYMKHIWNFPYMKLFISYVKNVVTYELKKNHMWNYSGHIWNMAFHMWVSFPQIKSFISHMKFQFHMWNDIWNFRKGSKPVEFAELVFENANVAESWKRWKWQRMQLMLPSPLAEKDENQLCGYFLL